MPAYSKVPGHLVSLLVEGVPQYLFGGCPLGKSPPKFLVSQVALTTNVATVTGTVIEGEIPTVPAAGQPSSLISIVGTSSNGGAFNVTAVAVTAVSITASTGAGTISFALTHANVSATADAGMAYIPQPETAETLVAGASVPITIPVQDPRTDSARTVDVVVSFPTLPTGATVNLQWAIFDQDSEYANVSTTPVAVVAGSSITGGPSAQYTLNSARFYRLNVSGLTGSGTIIGKVLA